MTPEQSQKVYEFHSEDVYGYLGFADGYFDYLKRTPSKLLPQVNKENYKKYEKAYKEGIMVRLLEQKI